MEDKEPDYDKMIKELLQECNLRKAMIDLITIQFCALLLSKTKHNIELYKVAKKKVLETLQPMQIYKDYIKQLTTNN